MNTLAWDIFSQISMDQHILKHNMEKLGTPLALQIRINYVQHER